jgi:CheY-like chemotaxis protein
VTTAHSKAVAILAANPAFAAILSRALEQDGGYRVASFSSVEMLTTFLRISPVDVVVLDTDLPGAPAIDIARGLRNHLKLATSAFEIVALTRAAVAFHKPLLAAGIDAVLEKPVTPQQLLACIDGLTQVERAVAVQQQATTMVRAFEPRPQPAQRVGNVIPLFGEGRVRR